MKHNFLVLEIENKIENWVSSSEAKRDSSGVMCLTKLSGKKSIIKRSYLDYALDYKIYCYLKSNSLSKHCEKLVTVRGCDWKYMPQRRPMAQLSKTSIIRSFDYQD